MSKFENQLKAIIEHVQENLDNNAFVMYQPNFISIATFDKKGNVKILADAPMQEDAFTMLYTQIHFQIMSGSRP